MTKYNEEEILNAYKEFSADSRWVSGNSHEIIAYDFLKTNLAINEFLKKRDIYPMYLYYCINAISKADTFEERRKLVIDYCERHDIFFNKFFTLAFLHQLGLNRNLPFPNIEDYRILIRPDESDEEDYEEVVLGLAEKLREAVENHVKFGIMEYYAYYQTDLLELKNYLDEKEDFKLEYEIVRSYIEDLELSGQLVPVAYKSSLAPASKSVVQGLYINDVAFKEAVSQLLITRFPVLTGTLNYAYLLQYKGELGTLSKEKIKRKYENKVR